MPEHTLLTGAVPLSFLGRGPAHVLMRGVRGRVALTGRRSIGNRKDSAYFPSGLEKIQGKKCNEVDGGKISQFGVYFLPLALLRRMNADHVILDREQEIRSLRPGKFAQRVHRRVIARPIK